MRIITAVTAILSACLVGFYLANAFLYLSPPNPLKARYMAFNATVMHPLFAQNWHLFAPDPVTKNFVLAVRCRVGGQATHWEDVTTPLLARHHRSRHTPLARVLRVQQNAIFLFLGRSSDDWRPVLCRRNPSLLPCRPDDPETSRRQQMGRYVLERLAAEHCVRRFRDATGAQGRILIHEPPVWSRRHLPAEAGRVRYISLPWTSLDGRGG